jgi:hypothetical protein
LKRVCSTGTADFVESKKTQDEYMTTIPVDEHAGAPAPIG